MFEKYFQAVEDSPTAAKSKKRKEIRANGREWLGEGSQAPFPSTSIIQKNTTVQSIDGSERTVVVQDRIETTRSAKDAVALRTRDPSNHTTNVNLLHVASRMGQGESYRAGRSKKLIALPPVKDDAAAIVPPSPEVTNTSAQKSNKGNYQANAFKDVLSGLIVEAREKVSICGNSTAASIGPSAEITEEQKCDMILDNMKRLEVAKKMAPSKHKDRLVCMLEKRLDELTDHKYTNTDTNYSDKSDIK